MPNGFNGAVLRINLTTGTIEKQSFDEDFYRKYMGGSAFGTYFLLKETPADLDPLAPENIITIAPGVTTDAPVSGVSRCCMTALSPATGLIGDSQAGGSIGPMIKRAGSNIPWLRFLSYNRLRAHDLFYGKQIFVLESAASKLGEFYGNGN